jgi:hypothetical protein
MYSLNIILLSLYRLYLAFSGSKNIPILSVLTLFMPVFFILNGCFFIYWVFNLKAHDLIRYRAFDRITFINKFYKFSAEYPPDKTLR